MEQTYDKDILNWVLPTLQESNNADLTGTDLIHKLQVLSKEYYRALKFLKSKVSVVYKRKLNEVNIGPYNLVIVSLLKTTMNLQYATGIYAMLTYLTYLCKPEYHMSGLMKKASKEAYNKILK